MCITSKTNIKECVICNEEKKTHINCKICTDTNVCFDCSVQLCENGICNRCPICRQEDWKKIKTSRVKICIKKTQHASQHPTTNNPIHNNTTTNNNTITHKNDCMEVLNVARMLCNKTVITSILVFIGYSFLFGLVTLMIAIPESTSSFKKFEIILYALLIGMVEVIILFNCCRIMCCN